MVSHAGISQKARTCMAALSWWDKSKTGGYGRCISAASSQVQLAIHNLSFRGSWEVVLSAETSLGNLLMEEEI